MSIPITTPANVQTSNTPAFQDWSISGSPIFEWRQGNLSPNSQTITLKIRDIIDTELAANMVNFKFWFTGIGKPDWLNIDCDYYSPTSSTPIIVSGMSTDITISMVNYLQMISGYYSHNLLIYITGQTPIDIQYNTNSIISYFHLPVTFRIYEPNQCVHHPFSLNFYHRLGTPLPPAQEMIFSSPTWEVHAPNGFILSSDDPSVSIEVLYGSFYKASGSGSKTVKFGLSAYHDTLAISPDPYIEYCSPSPRPSSNPFLSFPINIWILEDVPFEVIPNPLIFNAIKNIDEADPIEIIVNSHFDYNIEFSPWLTLPTTSGSSGSTTINVTPISSSNLDAGTYDGFLKFSYNSDEGPQEFVVPVTYNVEGFVQTPYSLNRYNFTLDDKYILFNTTYEETFFDLKLMVKTFDFFSGNTREYILPFKIPMFQKKQKFNIGLIIHRLMARFEQPSVNSTNQYNATVVKMEFTERYAATGEDIREFISDDFKFIAGLSPKLYNSNFAILDLQPEETRVLSNSNQRINLMMPIGTGREIKIFKNGNLISSYYLSNSFSTYTDNLDFASINAKQGDRIEYRLQIDELNFVSKFFIVFPEQTYFNTIYWEDEFLLTKNFDFTGKLEIKNDYESKNQSMYVGIMEKLISYESIKTPKLNINTGFILKSDIPTIESIIRSRRVWIDINNELVELVPVTKSISTADTDKATINFDLDFQINRKNNEEVCTQ